MKKIKLLLLFILPLCLSAQVKVFYNARIFTANKQQPFAEAIAINGKKIIAVGLYSDVKKAAGNTAEQVDCNGAFLMPGFIDSHIHAISGGRGLTKANTSDKLFSTDELVAYAKEMLRKKEGMTGDVLVIHGINISTWSHLDEIRKQFNTGEFAGQPVVLRGSDGHTSWSNNAMMKRAGLDKKYIQSLKPEEKIYFGIVSGDEPNGFASEDGQEKIRAAIPPDPDFKLAAEKAMQYCNALGITALLDPGAGNAEKKNHPGLDAYDYLLQNGKLTAHVATTIVSNADGEPQPQIDFIKSLQKKYSHENLEVLGSKVFADGVIEHPTHTAALSLPYTGRQSKGVLMFDPEKFKRFTMAADKNNLLVHVHAIGDRAVTETLNGFEAARLANGNKKLPHTITHLQIVKPADFERFAKLNVLLSY